MRNVLHAVYVLLLILMGCWCQSSWAETCNASTAQMTININNITYLPTLPVNTQMTNQMPDNGSGIRFNCDLQPPKTARKRIVYQQRDKSGGGITINGHHVFATKIDGIGYSLGFQCAGGAVRYINGNNAPDGSESVTVCDSEEIPDLLTEKEIIVKPYITFYKTGQVSLISNNHAYAKQQPQVGMLYIDTGSGNKSSVMLDLAALNANIGASGSCQVTKSDINVNLGTVSRSEFRGKSLTAGNMQTFDIPVTCSAATDVRIGFFGVAADTGSGDTLALTQEANAASGVGVKLSYGDNGSAAAPAGKEVKINEVSDLPVLKQITANNTDHVENIKFQAQYVQTEDRVSAGTANSMATFVLVYN